MNQIGSTGSTGSTFIQTLHAHAHEGKESLPRDSCYPCYFDRARKGLPPAESATEQGDSKDPGSNDTEQAIQPEVAADSVQVAGDSETILLSALASDLPDPARVFWWFSSTPLPDQRIPAGMPVRSEAGSRLPMEADYWANEGDVEWTKVDRNARPKPEAKKRVKPRR